MKDTYNIKLVLNQEGVNKDLGPYLAGLWEGKGHINIPSLTKNNKRNIYPSISFSFHIKDKPLVISLVDLLGGNIRYKILENCIVWTIGERLQLKDIINIMNSYLRTPKIYEFNKLIDIMNKDTNLIDIINKDTNLIDIINKDTNLIKKYNKDESSINNNSWLSGFFDADGRFKVRFTEKNPLYPKRKERLELRITLEQRLNHPKTNESYLSIMNNIIRLFNINESNLKVRYSIPNYSKYYIIEITSLSRLYNFINYLNKYPLLTSKSNDYKDWLLIYNIINKTRRLNLSENTKLYIKNIKSSMNKNRITFNWSHLSLINIIKY